MSTYYYLGCDQCREMVPFWVSAPAGSGVIPSANRNPEMVHDFLNNHIWHGVIVFNEHDMRAEEYYDTLDDHPFYKKD